MPKKIIIAVAPCDWDYLKVSVEAQYNPKDISFTKSVEWGTKEGKAQDFPMVQFTSGQAITLTLELLFDSYDDHNGGKEVDVRAEVTKLMQFVHVIDKIKTPRPPMVQLFWGTDEPLFDGKPFTGVVTSVDTHYTMFTEDGRACRATSKISLKQAEIIVDGEGGDNGGSSDQAPASAAEASNYPDDYAYSAGNPTDDGTGSDNKTYQSAEENGVDLTSPGAYSK